MNYQTDLDEVKRLATQGGHADLLQALDDASYGATSGEILMATRHHLRQFVAAHPAADATLLGHAQKVVAAIDSVLP